jgi:hypothetical protein
MAGSRSVSAKPNCRVKPCCRCMALRWSVCPSSLAVGNVATPALLQVLRSSRSHTGGSTEGIVGKPSQQKEKVSNIDQYQIGPTCNRRGHVQIGPMAACGVVVVTSPLHSEPTPRPRAKGVVGVIACGCRKTRSREIRKNKIALGSSTNDFLNFLGILYPPNFGCLGGNWTFSTATPVYNISYFRVACHPNRISFGDSALASFQSGNVTKWECQNWS